MKKVIDWMMPRLFQLAEYVCNRCSPDKGKPAATLSQPHVPTIRFSNEDRMVEGELFEYI